MKLFFNGFKRVWLLTPLFILLFTSMLCAQTPVHTHFPTGIDNDFTAVHVYDVDSNSLILSYFASTTGIFNDIQISVKINKANLSIVDTVNIPNTYTPSLKNYGGGYINNKDFTKTFYAYSTTDTVGLTMLSFFNVDTDYEIEDTLFSIQVENKKIWFARFINNQFVVGYTNTLGYDSLFIKTFNLNGELQSSREYDAFSQTDNQIYGQTIGIIGALEHPQVEDAFILAHPTQYKIFVVNQNTLDTVRTYNVDTLGAYLINYAGYWTAHNSEMRVEDDGVVLTGTVHIDPDTNIQTSGFDFQYYEFKQFWDGTFSIRDFGPRDVDNRGYASGINRSTNTKVIAGAIPFSFASFTAAEKREVLVYVYDDYGRFDSIYLHGDYNHVPTQLLVDDNGDIFIAGMYTEAWDSGAVHAWLSKIPGLAVGMIEQNKINNHLFIYPNPTVETIQIKEVSNFINGEFQIYSQSGVLVKQGRVTGQEIEVSSFTAGVYVLTVKSQNEEQFNAIFVKE